MLVTVSGKAGTGTTTLSQKLSNELGLPHYYAGAIFREMARERDMSLQEFSSYAEDNHEIDMELDERMVEIAQREHAVLEGRLAGWHADRAGAEGFRVLLTATDQTRAQRLAKREDEPVREILQDMRARDASEAKRYEELYDLDPEDPDLYDLVVDTEDLGPDEVAETVLDALPDDEAEGGGA